MKSDVIVSVKSIRGSVSEGVLCDDAQNDIIETVSPGRCLKKSGKIYVHYEEVLEEAITAKCLLKIDNNSVEVSKSGQIESCMLFKQNKNTGLYYETPYGRLPIRIFTKNLEIFEKEEEIDIMIGYNLNIGSGEAIENIVEIRIMPVP